MPLSGGGSVGCARTRQGGLSVGRFSLFSFSASVVLLFLGFLSILCVYVEGLEVRAFPLPSSPLLLMSLLFLGRQGSIPQSFS